MRNLKKFLALVLAMMMAMSLMITANAANEADNATKTYPDGDSVTPAFTEAVDVLSGMGVFQGRDTGNFDAGATINRAETAAIIYRLMTADVDNVQVDLYRNVSHPFTDVKPGDWYAGYIGFLWNAGIIKGQTATTFNPLGKVTGYEALAMILRAVGYDQNHEFEGTNWVVNVASIAQRKGILKDVETANYGGPQLYSPARRDVVASLLFRTAAYVPQVVYTPALGYQEYGMGDNANATQGNSLIGGAANPTLGYTNFGLTYARGIVVGNQATGENATKIGFSGNPQRGTANFVNNTNWVDYINSNAYYYNSYTTVQTGVDEHDAPVYGRSNNVSLYFDWTTDLRMFNHATRVWFDYRGDGYSSKIKTYALYDDVVATAIVTTDKTVTDADGVTVAAMAALVDGTDDAANNWDKTKMVSGGSAFFNYAFAAMNGDNYNTAAGEARTTDLSGGGATGDISAMSPVLNNDGDTIDTVTTHPLYLLISNRTSAGDNVLDVVISLDMTMSKIVQSNTTTDPRSVGVLATNTDDGTTHQYFGVTADDGLLTGALGQGATKSYVTLFQGNLLNTPKTDLGTKVAAIEITGTKGGVKTTVAPGAVTAGTASAKAPMTSTYWYQLTENTKKETYTVSKVDTVNQDVYMTDGTVLKQSIFAEDVDAAFTKDMEGYDPQNAGIFNTGFRLVAGRDYTFTLDEAGHYIYWETPSDSAEFVYGTYIDFDTAVASSKFDYPMVYVNTEGEGNQKVNVTSVFATDGTSAAYGTSAAMDNESYDTITLPKRDKSGTSGGNVSGFVAGRYAGYAKGDDGKLTLIGTVDDHDTGFLQDDGTHFGTSLITINSRSVTIGNEATNVATLFLTNNTKFIIVDGAGTDNQKVTVKNGIADLMDGMDKVEINGNVALSSSAYLNPLTNPYEMFYYKAGPFEYDQSYDPSAREVKTLFLPAACIKFTAKSTASMVFVGDSSAKIINSNNGNWATLFTVYRNGEGEDVWIKGHYTTAGTDAYTVVNSRGANDGDNVFYNLVDSGDKATDGKPIYNIAPVADDAKILGDYWDDTDGDGVGDTVTTKPLGYDTLYKATTYSQQIAYIGGTSNSTDLYNVGSAGIKNLNTSAYPGIADNDLNALNGASSLWNNVGVPVSCILSDDYVVSFIYINA